LAALRIDSSNLKHVSQHWLADREVILVAVERNGYNLSMASPVLSSCLRIVSQISEVVVVLVTVVLVIVLLLAVAVVFVIGHFARMLSICVYSFIVLPIFIEMICCSNSWLDIRSHVGVGGAHDQELKDDRELVLVALTNSGGSALQFASEHLRGTRDIVVAAIHASRSQNQEEGYYAWTPPLKVRTHLPGCVMHTGGFARQCHCAELTCFLICF
jgi:hypothetical protein